MGKGYNNFMSKKPFHPASKENIKRVWMAEQRSIDYKKKEEEMRLQYEKEQDLYNNRLLVAGSDSKDKLSLNFMYEAPPGVKKENKGELESETEPQYKFEWQRNAPRESFAKNNTEIRDQPFGIQVRNVRCLKCHKWGHVNTDRDCPLFNTSFIPSSSSSNDKSNNEPAPAKMEQSELIASMKEDQGLALKKSLYGNYGPQTINGDSHQMLATKNPEVAFLESLSSKEKKRLLKKLQKLTESKLKHKKQDSKKKHKKDKKKKKSSHKSSSSDDSENEKSDEDRRREKKRDRHYHQSSHRNGHHNHDDNDDEKPRHSSRKEHRHHRERSRSRSREGGRREYDRDSRHYSSNRR